MTFLNRDRLSQFQASPHFIASPLGALTFTLNFTVNSLRNNKVINSNKVNAGNKLKAIELVLKNQGRLKDVQEVSQTVEDKSITDLLAELNKE